MGLLDLSGAISCDKITGWGKRLAAGIAWCFFPRDTWNRIINVLENITIQGGRIEKDHEGKNWKIVPPETTVVTDTDATEGEESTQSSIDSEGPENPDGVASLQISGFADREGETMVLVRRDNDEESVLLSEHYAPICRDTSGGNAKVVAYAKPLTIGGVSPNGETNYVRASVSASVSGSTLTLTPSTTTDKVKDGVLVKLGPTETGSAVSFNPLSGGATTQFSYYSAFQFDGTTGAFQGCKRTVSIANGIITDVSDASAWEDLFTTTECVP